MPRSADDTSDSVYPSFARSPRRRMMRRLGFVLFGMLVLLAALAWSQRENIARDIIGDELGKAGISATYDIAEISPERQVLTNLVVGDPDRPDLIVKRIEIDLKYGFGLPGIGRTTVIEPRLYGSYRNGRLSFGSLDKLLFAESDDESGLPSLDLRLVDGRALIETDFGPVGIKADGRGQLDDGFFGVLAVNGPSLAFADCTAERATAYGEIRTRTDAIRFEGPIRLGTLDCPSENMALYDAAIAVELSAASDFSTFDVDAQSRTGAFALGPMRGARIAGPLSLGYDEGGIDATFDMVANDLISDQAQAAEIGFDGRLRTDADLVPKEIRGDLTGNGIDLSVGLSERVAKLAASSEGTFAEPLLRKLHAALDRQLNDATLVASFIGTSRQGRLSLTVPQAEMRGSGGALLSLSRLQLTGRGEGTPRVSGNFRIGGGGLPSAVGRMEQGGSDRAFLRVRMDEYLAGSSSLAIPEMLLTQSSSGAIGFVGGIEASGPLPGGFARGLRLPIRGGWNRDAGLALWRQCTEVGFRRLEMANLALSGQRLTLCPASGQPILSWRDGALKIAAGAASLNLSGSLAGTPIRIASGPIGGAYPGVVAARELDIQLGPVSEANRFRISNLDASFGDGIKGSFDDADISLAAIPLDLSETQGDWDYTEGILRITGASFVLSDREAEPRFEPLAARDATLLLEDNIINAAARLRHPASDRIVTDVDIRHDLGSGTGWADLRLDGLEFDRALQPDQLSQLALGVIANAEGIVTGTGRIDWSSGSVTSRGSFSSQSLDFAAAFGPVRGASGTIEFTDLLSLTTAPDQTLKVASVNPGIEVENGTVGFSLQNGRILGVTGGSWPFMGGTLTLRPVELNLGTAEVRRYVLEVDGLDAALFVENLELGNIAATGLFDGELPLVFDAEGNGRIEGGALQSRPPGGNVSYVGELTYEDLSFMANYAFDMLKSLDYRSMTIAMDGSLTGDIVTRVRFDGVKQGAGTKQNFITRQIADLPIRMNVNITAPFYKLITTLKSMYDPSAVRDPRELGLFDDDGIRFVPADEPLPEPAAGVSPIELLRPDESDIQNSDSEDMP